MNKVQVVVRQMKELWVVIGIIALFNRKILIIATEMDPGDPEKKKRSQARTKTAGVETEKRARLPTLRCSKDGLYPIKWTQLKVGSSFKINRADVAQSGVKTVTILPDLQLFKDDRTVLGVGQENVSDAFGFEGGEKALRHGVIVAVADAAHAEFDQGLSEGTKVSGGVV